MADDARQPPAGIAGAPNTTGGAMATAQTYGRYGRPGVAVAPAARPKAYIQDGACGHSAPPSVASDESAHTYPSDSYL